MRERDKAREVSGRIAARRQYKWGRWGGGGGNQAGGPRRKCHGGRE
jgi:hypothetical protein